MRLSPFVFLLVHVVTATFSAVAAPQAQPWRDSWSNGFLRDASGPLTRAAQDAGIRLAAPGPPPAGSAAAMTPPSGRADWSRIAGLEGKDIVLTLAGSPPGRRHVLRGTVDGSGLTVLKLSDPTMPDSVIRALTDVASKHPEWLSAPVDGPSIRVTRHVRISGGGVFLDNRKIVDLQHVVEHVDRSAVVEVRLVHRATRRGAAWGGLAGPGLGLAIVLPQCGLNWSQETASCANLTPSAVFVLAVLGVALGAAYGSAARLATVVYSRRADSQHLEVVSR